METLDAPGRQSLGLPPINHLDGGKVKREEMDYHRKHSAPATASPLHPYSGPSHAHAFSNHQSTPATSLPGPFGGLLSPPESRRTSGDEKDQRQPARQSLPSIHEALGSEPAPYPSLPPSAPASASQSFLPPSSATSPSDPRRAFSVDHINSQGPPSSLLHPRSPYMNSSGPAPPPPPSQADSLPRSTLPPMQQGSRHPTLHPLRTTQSPPPGIPRPHALYSSYPPHSSSAYDSPTPHSAGPVNPPYGYSQYPSNHPLSAPPPGAPGAGYPPSAATYSAPPARYPPPSWPRSESIDLGRLEDKKIGRPSLAPYGESVKRHLESFDLEASLNEMAEGAGRITDFSKVYGQRAHDNTRIGMTPQSMPNLEEVDEMVKQSEKISISLQRMREVVFNHQQTNIVEPPHESHYRPINGYDHEGQNPFHDDAKGGGGFAGGDSKKPRKGRAAPPGRCHSCNRAETPEWRRGPDGARTLCNACGLHYAKLTRKMGGKQAMSTSNLRPKSISDGPPGT